MRTRIRGAALAITALTGCIYAYHPAGDDGGPGRDASDATDVYVSRCAPNAGACNPVDGTGCGMGQYCTWASNGSMLQTICAPGQRGTGLTGASCTTTDQCAPGYLCLSEQQCVKLCCIGNDDDCHNGTGGDLLAACVFPTPSALPGTLGVCGHPCDWSRQDACLESQHCAPSPIVPGTFCTSGGTVGTGGACDPMHPAPTTTCARGNTCANGSCLEACDTLSPTCASCTQVSGYPTGDGVCL